MCDQCPPLLHVWMTTVVVPTRPSGIIGMALVAEPSPLLSPKSTRTCELALLARRVCQSRCGAAYRSNL